MRCKFARSSYRSKFPWLGEACRAGKWSVHCRLCRVEFSWCKKQVFVRHANCESHCRVAGGEFLEAPPAEIFREVLSALVNGTAAGKDGIAACGAHKFRRVARCLDDAMKSLHRDAIRTAESITISRDERKGRACLRFAAIQPDLSARRGMLAWSVVTDSSADGLVRLTSKAFTDISTKQKGSVRKKIVKSCRQKLRIASHAMSVDAASNEVLASELQRTNGAVLEPLTPHSSILRRDTSHATRRLISRPTRAIPQLAEVTARFVHARGSPAQLVHWSPQLQVLFSEPRVSDDELPHHEHARCKA